MRIKVTPIHSGWHQAKAGLPGAEDCIVDKWRPLKGRQGVCHGLCSHGLQLSGCAGVTRLMADKNRSCWLAGKVSTIRTILS